MKLTTLHLLKSINLFRVQAAGRARVYKRMKYLRRIYIYDLPDLFDARLIRIVKSPCLHMFRYQAIATDRKCMPVVEKIQANVFLAISC